MNALRDNTELWLVAATIATEVPPAPVTNPNTPEAFTAAMIPLARQAVAEVIRTRMRSGLFPATAAAVVLQPKQFSAVLRGVTLADVGHRDIWQGAVDGTWCPQHVQACLETWQRVLAGALAPVVPVALYYYSPVSMRPPLATPGWVAGKTQVVCPGLSPAYFRFYR